MSEEDNLSFDLLTINKCRWNEFYAARSMLTLQQLLRKYARDVLGKLDTNSSCQISTNLYSRWSTTNRSKCRTMENDSINT